MPKGKYTVAEARDEALRLVSKHAKGTDTSFLHEAQSYTELIIAIDMLIRAQPFNLELKGELGSFKDLINVQRRG